VGVTDVLGSVRATSLQVTHFCSSPRPHAAGGRGLKKNFILLEPRDDQLLSYCIQAYVRFHLSGSI